MKKNKKILLLGYFQNVISGAELGSQYELKMLDHKKNYVKKFSIDTNNKNKYRGKLNFYNIKNSLTIFVKYFWMCATFRPHIVIIPLPQNFYGFIKYSIFILISNLHNVKIISRLGGQHFKNFYNLRSLLYKKYINYIIGKVSKIYVRGESLKKQFLKITDENKLSVIPNLFEIKKNINIKKIKTKTFNILYIGSVSRAKGFFIFMKCLIFLKKKKLLSNIKIYIVGQIIDYESNIFIDQSDKGLNQKTTINRFIKEFDGCKITYIEHINNKDIYKLHKKISLLVVPSYSEGYPYTILEAFAYKTPVISTPVGALKDFLKNKEEIIFTPIGDFRKLSKKIILLKNNPNLISKITKNAYKYLRKTHAIKNIKKKFRLILEEL